MFLIVYLIINRGFASECDQCVWDTIHNVFMGTSRVVKLAPPENSQVVVICGNTGAGKTTLMHVLTNRELDPVLNNKKKLVFKAREPEEKLRIADPTSYTSTTMKPVVRVYPDDNPEFYYIDTAGFGHVNADGVGQDALTEQLQRIINAYSMNQIIERYKDHVKFIVCVAESELETTGTDKLRRLIDSLEFIFQSEGNSSCTIVTKAPHSFTGEDSLTGEQVREIFRNRDDPNMKNMGNRPASVFYSPIKVAVQATDGSVSTEIRTQRLDLLRTEIQQNIRELQPLCINHTLLRNMTSEAPRVRESLVKRLKHNSTIFILRFIELLKEGAINFILTANHSTAQVRNDLQALSRLRGEQFIDTVLQNNDIFNNDALLLKRDGLFSNESPSWEEIRDIRRFLMRVFDSSENDLNILQFNQKLFDLRLGNLNFNGVIERVATDLQSLSANPISEFINDTLTCKGGIIGMSDINRLLSQYENVQSVDIYSLCAFLVDENSSKLNGSNVTVFAPIWKVLEKPTTIELKGADAGDIHGIGNQRDGENGAYGAAGGNFLGAGLHFINKENVVVNVSGGNGGRGAPGIDGNDGRLEEVERRNSNCVVGSYAVVEKKRTIYISSLNESPGGRAGAAGLGGSTGDARVVDVTGRNILDHILKKPGRNGDVGSKGRNGKLYAGIWQSLDQGATMSIIPGSQNSSSSRGSVQNTQESRLEFLARQRDTSRRNFEIATEQQIRTESSRHDGYAWKEVGAFFGASRTSQSQAEESVRHTAQQRDIYLQRENDYAKAIAEVKSTDSGPSILENVSNQVGSAIAGAATTFVVNEASRRFSNWLNTEWIFGPKELSTIEDVDRFLTEAGHAMRICDIERLQSLVGIEKERRQTPLKTTMININEKISVYSAYAKPFVINLYLTEATSLGDFLSGNSDCLRVDS